MATMRGLVDYIKIGDDYGFVRIEEDTGNTEIFIIWFLVPSDPLPVSRITTNWWLSLLREALVHRLEVRITHGESSAFITQVELFGVSPPDLPVVDNPLPLDG